MQNPGNLRFGYLPNRTDLSAPSDRRRFCYYARARGLDWEIYRDSGKYDVIVLCPLADLTEWSRLPRGGAPIVYDMPDSYLELDDRQWKSRLRGTAKYAFRQHRHLEWDYKESLRRMFARADAVLCSTEEQRASILSLNANVHAILDFHTGEVSHVKANHRRSGDTLHLFWEGIGGNLIVFDEVRDALLRLAKRLRIALHLFTDVWQKPFNAPVPKLPTRRLIRSLTAEIPTFMYEWNAHMLAPVATACDLALIPILMTDPLYVAKPENKLLLMWRMGIPTITSQTPAYVRTMEAAGLRMYAGDSVDWERLIGEFAESETARENAAGAGSRYVSAEHSESKLLAKWDALIASVAG